MARIPVSKMRRLELEKAVYESISESGFQGFALEEVARHAGTAKGTIHHYFLNKEELMEGFVRYANRLFADTILQMIKAARSPSERLWSIIALNLDPEFFQPTLTRAYVLGLALGIRYRSVLRIYDATHHRSISNLVFALRSLAEPEDVKNIANAIWIMIEGAWMLQAVRSEDISGATLSAIADYLKNSVPGFDPSVVNRSATQITPG